MDRILLVQSADMYRLLAAFCIYSVLGWSVESVYMSFCNRKLTNRGFVKGPFCPIYGFGAMAGYFLLQPFAKNVILLYFAGALLATTFEYIVGRLMQRMFGEFWWDYRDKPFNYQGVICLESTIAWGFYAVIIVGFLHREVLRTADLFTRGWGLWILRTVILVFTVDFFWHFLKALHIDMGEQRDRLVEKYRSFRKW